MVLTIFPSLGRAINTQKGFILYRNRNRTKTWKGTEWKMDQKTDSYITDKPPSFSEVVRAMQVQCL